MNSSGDDELDFFTTTSSTTTQCAPEATKFGEITQIQSHCAIQGHSRSPILISIKSWYTTSYYWLIVTYTSYLAPLSIGPKSLDLVPLLRLTTQTEGFPWDNLRKFFHGCQRMAKVPNGVEILPKISTGWVGRRALQTTDGRAIAYTPCLRKNCANFFLSELRQISTNFGNFWQKDGKEAKITRGALNFHLT